MLQQVSTPIPAQVQAPPVTCRHHWIIEEPVGPVSMGVCRVCSEVREFKNYIESAPWGEDSAAQALSSLMADSPPDDLEEAEGL